MRANQTLAPLKKAVFAIKGMNKFLGTDRDTEPPKQQVIVQQMDPKITDMVKKQQKKLKNVDMQVLALVSEQKSLRKEFDILQTTQL